MNKCLFPVIAVLSMMFVGGFSTTRSGTAHAEMKSLLPEFDVRNNQWKPQGDRAWLFTGFTEWPAKITAMDVTADGTGLVIGDADGFVGFYSLTEFSTVWRKQLYRRDADMHIEALAIDPTGRLVAVGALGTNRAYAINLVVLATGNATVYPIDKSPYPPCNEIGVELDPIQFRWLPGGKGLFINFNGHVTANRDLCVAPMERWLCYRNFEAGRADFRMIHLDSYKKPEGDEPPRLWKTDQPYMDVTRNGRTAAVSAGNGRMLIYDVVNHKIQNRIVSRSIYYWLAERGLEVSAGNGYVLFDSSNNVYEVYSHPTGLVDTYILKFTPDLKDVSVVAKTSGPMPELRMTPNERYLMCAGEHIDLWDLRSARSLYHGPYGKCDGFAARFHPKKRIVMVPAGKRIHYLIERPVRKLVASPGWTSAGVMVRAHDSVYVRGSGKIGAGFGSHRTDRLWWPKDELFLNKTLPYGSDDDDIVKEGELFVASVDSCEVEIYGGRTAEEASGLSALLSRVPAW